MIGVENLKKIVMGVSDVVTLVPKVLDDGITVSDLRYLGDAFGMLRVLFSIDLSGLKAEVDDLDVQEKQELSALFAERFDLPNDSVETALEAGVSMLFEVISQLSSLRELFDRIRAILKKDSQA